MAAELGKNFTRLIEDLQKNAPSYNVFYAIFLCETISKKLHPNREEEKLEQTGLKFRPYEQFVYPPKDIRSFEFKDDVMSFVLNFMGLYGVNSPLPRCYQEQVAMQQNIYGPGEVPLQNFLDIFNNRFYWLYYQAWKKYRYYLQLSEDPNNKTMQRVFSFIGKGPQVKKEESKISTFQFLQYSGILSARIRNRVGLHILLRGFFPKFEMRLKEFVPHMVKLAEIPEVGSNGEGPAFQLGVNSIVGKSMLDYMSRICIEIGPMEFDDYLQFTPGSEKADLLNELLKLYLNDGLEYDIKFTINAASIKTIAWNDKRLKLGSTIWLGKPKQKVFDFYYKYEKFVGAN